MGAGAIIAIVDRLFDGLLELRENAIQAAENGGQFTEEEREAQRAHLASQRETLDAQDARLERLLRGDS